MQLSLVKSASSAVNQLRGKAGKKKRNATKFSEICFFCSKSITWQGWEEEEECI
jgi:hypothetical protein